MKSIKLHITHLSDPMIVEEAQRQYTHAFMLLYNMFDRANYKDFVERFMQRFNFTDIGYDSLVQEVKQAIKQDKSNDDDRKERITMLEFKLLGAKPKDKVKIYKKISKIKRRIGKARTFGGVSLLQDLTRECNKPDRDPERIAELREAYRKARIKPVYIMGEANQRANRFINFTELHLGKCTYKPNKHTHCDITFKVSRSRDLERLAQAAKEKALPISVHLTTEYIAISFDEQTLNGYGLDEKARRKAVKVVKSEYLPKDEETLRIKDVYKSFYDRQREHMLENKIEHRCMAVDLNPTNVGWSVLDRTEDGECKVVACGQYEYSWLCRKTGKASHSAEQKHLNNKRKYEMYMVVRALLRTAMHYKCAMFVIEDLEFDKNSKGSREANRKNRNVWNRGVIVSTITRRCNESGMELRKVNACYSSFIGNIRHPYVDATNASIEIGRRGLWKYTNGTMYPEVRMEDLSSVEAKFGADAEGINTCGWGAMYKALTGRLDKAAFAYRLRTALEGATPHRVFSMNTCRSGVKCITFNTLH